MKFQDGRLQVAIAIGSISKKVTVTLANADPLPFRTVPPDLFDRNFNDQAVGLSNTDIRDFKALLATLLPDIKGKIENDILENANLPIHEVAEQIRLALLAHREGGSR